MSSSSSPPSFSSVRFSFKRLFAYLLTTNQTQVMGRLLGTPRRPCQARPRHLAPHLFFSLSRLRLLPPLSFSFTLSLLPRLCAFQLLVSRQALHQWALRQALVLSTQSVVEARPRAPPCSDHVRASVEPPTFPIHHPASLFTHSLSLLLSPLLPSPVWAVSGIRNDRYARRLSCLRTAHSLRPALRSSTRLCKPLPRRNRHRVSTVS